MVTVLSRIAISYKGCPTTGCVKSSSFSSGSRLVAQAVLSRRDCFSDTATGEENRLWVELMVYMSYCQCGAPAAPGQGRIGCASHRSGELVRAPRFSPLRVCGALTKRCYKGSAREQ